MVTLYSDVQVQEGMFDKDNYWKVQFVTFKSCRLVTEKHFPIYDLGSKQQYFYSHLYAPKAFSKHVYINLLKQMKLV